MNQMLPLPEQIDGKRALLRIEPLGPATLSASGWCRFQARARPLGAWLVDVVYGRIGTRGRCCLQHSKTVTF